MGEIRWATGTHIVVPDELQPLNRIPERYLREVIAWGGYFQAALPQGATETALPSAG